MAYLFIHCCPDIAVHEPNATIVVYHSAGRLPTTRLIIPEGCRTNAVRLDRFADCWRCGLLRQRLLAWGRAVGILLQQFFASRQALLEVLIRATTFTGRSRCARDTCDVCLRRGELESSLLFARFCLVEESRLPESGTRAQRWDANGTQPGPTMRYRVTYLDAVGTWRVAVTFDLAMLAENAGKNSSVPVRRSRRKSC
jgi:hypothetical protein